MAHFGIQNLLEAALYVDDLEKAEVFYRDVLCMEVIGKEPGRHVFFRAGNGVLLIFNPEATSKGDTRTPHGAKGPGHAALGINSDSLDSWRARLQKHGIEIEDEVAWPKGGHSLYFRDPAQNCIELVTPGCWGLPSGW